jgi:ferrous iron transport protein B
VLTEVDAIRAGLGPGESVGLVDSRARYEWIASQLRGVIRESENRDTLTDRVDRVLLHGLWGQLIAALTLLVLFQAVFTVADPASAAIDALTGVLSDAVQAFLPAGALQSLLTDGLIQGVGGVLVFLPQIFLLFFFIALLEDTGYLARVACLMDRVMSRVGLSGKSFIPLLSSFACAIPGIMAARVIEDRRDRLVTVLIAPLMCCSARLPVYTLLIAAFIPDRRYLGGVLGTQGLTMLALYLLGMLVAIGVAFLLKRFVLPGETPSFLLELPAYKRPSLGVVLRKMWNGGWAFVQGAGTLIVAVTVLVWAAAYFPAREQPVDAGLLARRDDLLQRLANGDVRSEEVHLELSRVEGQIRGLQMRRSYLGVVGRFIEPVVRPLGWDWRIGCGVIASFPAREVVVATMGVLYNLGDEQSEHSQSLRQTLRESTWEGSDRPVFNIPVALSVMVFFALCAQCASTLAVMRRETNSWRWPAFAFSYMTVLAYFAALITYQVGMLMSS